MATDLPHTTQRPVFSSAAYPRSRTAHTSLQNDEKERERRVIVVMLVTVLLVAAALALGILVGV